LGLSNSLTYQPPLRRCYDRGVNDDRCELLCLDLPKAEALRAARLPQDLTLALAERAKALADPTRLTIATALAQTDELCVCDLAWVTERAENLVSHHVRALRTAGIVTSRRDGKMVMYTVTDAGRALLAAVLGDVELRLER
jgi:ArsR family transcriptional regulator, lead/cadmium/zinc/bismuth-responsive transcriptional repressor